MSNERRPADRPSARALLRTAVAIAGLIGAFYFDTQSQRWSSAGQAWGYLAVGGFLAAEAVSDVRRGTAHLLYSTFQRTEDATGFWTAVAITAALGVAGVIIALGTFVSGWKT